ncbi:Appr-1-p processing protein [Haloplanus sp. GCM10025708]|uniref:Appr-1-p processing protein n=1 Tax=Haloferacaceae TaxID=1644056 RepID=UPI00361BB55C
MDFEVVRSDVAEQAADAVVNAANTSLRVESGVAGALGEAGGEALDDADYVVHAATMPAGGRASAQSIHEATRSALEGADIIGEEITAFDPESLADVRFIAYGTEEYEVVKRATAEYR